MGRPSLSETHETVIMTLRVPADRYDRLIKQAERRGLTWGGGPAQSEITLMAIEEGLMILEGQKGVKKKTRGKIKKKKRKKAKAT